MKIMESGVAVFSMLVIGTVCAAGAFSFAYLIGEPIITRFFGSPYGQGEDFMTRSVFGRAILIQLCVLLPVFSLIGRIKVACFLRFSRLVSALVIANPITVGLGYWIYYEMQYTGLRLDVEYAFLSLGNFLFWLGASLPVLAVVVFMTTRSH